MAERKVMVRQVLALLLMALCSGGCTSRDGSPGATPLTAGVTLERTLTGEASHDYVLELPAAHHARIRVNQCGIDLALELWQRGNPVLRADRPTGKYGDEWLSLLSGDGRVRLRVVSIDAAGSAGSYSIAVEAVRPEAPGDKAWLAAERTYLSAYANSWHTSREVRVQAIADYRAALPAYLALGDLWTTTEIFTALGRLHYEFDEAEQAEAEILEGLLLAYHTGDREAAARFANNLANTRWLHDLEGARPFYYLAYAWYGELGDPLMMAILQDHLGVILRKVGEWEKAYHLHQAAVTTLQQLERPGKLAYAHRNLARVLSKLNLDERARDHYRKVEDICRTEGLAWAGGELRYDQAGLEIKAQRLERAEELLREALAHAHKSAEPRLRAQALGELANLELMRRRPAEALVLLEEALALEQGRIDINNLYLSGFAYERLLATAPSQARPALLGKARRFYEQAGRLAEEHGDLHQQAGALMGIAGLLDKAGEEPLDHLQAALTLVEDLRWGAGRPDFRTAWFSSQAEVYLRTITAMLQRHRREGGQKWAREALRVAEQLQARVLTDLLTLGKPTLDVAQHQREERYWVQRGRLAMDDLLGRPAAEDLLDEISALARARARSMPRPETIPSIAELMRLSDEPDTLVLEYQLGPEASWLWALKAGKVTVYTLPPRGELASLVGRAMAGLEQPGSQRDHEAMHALSRILLPHPLAGQLVIVPDGMLERLPFEVLPTDGAGRELLVDRHDVAYLPSLSALQGLRKKQRRQHRDSDHFLAVFADPLYRDEHLPAAARSSGSTLPRLPGTDREARAILALASKQGRHSRYMNRERATRAQLMAPASARYSYLHLAAHAVVEPGESRGIGLILSGGGEGKENGFVSIPDILSLDLEARMVVLSACRTAQGKAYEGEGIVSLARAFMYAGVPRVVASLWQVDDLATAELMTHFYTNLWERNMGPARALAEAKRALRAQEQWRDPYHWAGFLLIGDWHVPPLLPSGPKSRSMEE